jgi:hypothetical protein
MHLDVGFMPRTLTLCIHLDAGFSGQNCYTVYTFRCGCIAQNFYTVHTFRYGLYCPELLYCAYIYMWALLPRTVMLCIH